MKNILYTCIALVLLSLNSCFAPEPLSPESADPIIREATIAVFDPIIDTSINFTSPTFNIATFKFPSSSKSSGSLPNDERFSQGSWFFQESNFPLPGYTTTYNFQEPPNSLQTGDVLVDSIYIHPTNPLLSKVILRFKGKFVRIPRASPLLTENADSIATVFKNLANDTLRFFTGCDQLENQGIEYGDVKIGQLYTITANNPNGTPQNYQFPGNWPSTKTIGQFMPPFKRLPSANMDTYTAEFALGDVFYYSAENGVNFFVSISNIREGLLNPPLRRVTFKFAEAYYCTICNPL